MMGHGPRHLKKPEKARYKAARAAGYKKLCEFFGPGAVTRERLDPCVYDFFRTDCNLDYLFVALDVTVDAFEIWAQKKGYVAAKKP